MSKFNYKLVSTPTSSQAITILETIPIEVKTWAASIPLNQRHYILSLLFHLIAENSPETKAEILDDFTADNLVVKILQDQVPQQLVSRYLTKFRIKKELDEHVLKSYVKQFYIHSSRDLNQQPYFYLDSVIRLVHDAEERNKFFYYILGCEILKMMFQMSWLQHERLYQLQKHQESFLKTYIKPIQYAHKINNIILPKYENVFFARRDYFIKKPRIKTEKLNSLVIDTFTTYTVTNLGFLIIHHLDFLVFDYDYIYNSEPEVIFT